MYYGCIDFSHVCVFFICLHIIGGASADTVWSTKSRFILVCTYVQLLGQRSSLQVMTSDHE